MPIVKKHSAAFDADALVSLAEFTRRSEPQPADSTDTDTADASTDHQSHKEPAIELVRNGAGDIIRIDVRCECGQTTSLHCEYETP
ncbi:MAG: hypothetical protein NXI04_20255 [Planctomycetaceae bacterium]|nr:hypothetical protein [Planctomycetaceae bacterium]